MHAIKAAGKFNFDLKVVFKAAVGAILTNVTRSNLKENGTSC